MGVEQVNVYRCDRVGCDHTTTQDTGNNFVCVYWGADETVECQVASKWICGDCFKNFKLLFKGA